MVWCRGAIHQPAVRVAQRLVERQLRVDEWHPYTSDWLEREQQVTGGFRSCEKMGRTLN
jgi:hypothetical protein